MSYLKCALLDVSQVCTPSQSFHQSSEHGEGMTEKLSSLVPTHQRHKEEQNFEICL